MAIAFCMSKAESCWQTSFPVSSSRHLATDTSRQQYSLIQLERIFLQVPGLEFGSYVKPCSVQVLHVSRHWMDMDDEVTACPISHA